MTPHELPRVPRSDYTAHAMKAAAARLPHADDHGRTANEAVQLDPFRRIQVAQDQLIGHADSVRRGEPFDFPGGFNAYAADALAHMDRHATTLEIAAAAARAQVDEITSHAKGLVHAMSKPKDEHPKLTTDGSPHPLEEGGYDANSDAGKPANMSDVGALKAGQASQAQAEAIAKADLAHNDEQPGDPFAPDDDGKDAGKPKPKPKDHGHGHDHAHKDKPKGK